MNRCNELENRAARRQRAYPATLPAELPVWPDLALRPTWRARLASLVSVAGYAAAIMVATGAVTALTVLLWRQT